MSNEISATTQIILESRQFLQGATQAEHSLDQVDRKGEEAGNKVDAGMRKGAAALGKFAATAAGIASGVASLYFQFDDLSKKQLRIETTALSVAKAQESLTKAQASGKTSAEELQIKTEQLRIAQERHKQALGDAQQAQIQFGLSMMTMGTTTIPLGIKNLKELGKELKEANIKHTLLNTTMGKWLIIGTAGILAYEGIAHAVKLLNPEIDITIEKLGGDLMQKMAGTNNQLNMAEASFGDAADSVSKFSAALDPMATGAISNFTTALEQGVKEPIDKFAEDLQKIKDGTTDLVPVFATAQGTLIGTKNGIIGYLEATREITKANKEFEKSSIEVTRAIQNLNRQLKGR